MTFLLYVLVVLIGLGVLVTYLVLLPSLVDRGRASHPPPPPRHGPLLARLGGVRRLALGCAAAAALVVLLAVAAGAAGLWWIKRGGPVVERTELVGPETQAFATFIATPKDRALLDLFASIERRADQKREGQLDWLHSIAEFLAAARISGDPGEIAALFPLRGSVLVEKPRGGESALVYVVSLGKMANLVRMFIGVADSERKTETFRGERITLGKGGRDVSTALVRNNLVVSTDPRAIRLIIERLKGMSGASRPSERLKMCIQGVDPSDEMPGFGGILNDRKSIAAVWQLGTGAPEGSEVALPDDFAGVGFRFAIASADAIRGDGYFYFQDEGAAAGSDEELRSGLARLFEHYGLKPQVSVRQDGSRLTVRVEAKGVQAALDRFFARVGSAAPTRPSA